MLELKELEIISADQSLYDNFNGFIMSSDTKVFGKMLARTLLLNQTKHVPGDIVECGVFKGTGIFTFLKLKRYINPNTLKKVIGFDFFDTNSLINNLSDQDKEAMSTLFEGRSFSHDKTYKQFLNDKIIKCGFSAHEFDLVSGDISETLPRYIHERPGMKISMLYLDLDLADPTYDVLCAAWDRVSKGGVVVFDEYAFHKWSESKGVDKFFGDKEIQVKCLDYIAPSAYVVKK